MERTNETWIQHLSGPERERALADLREILCRTLRRVFAKRSSHAFLEDVVQDALVRILERRSQFQGRSRFLTWATSIAIRVAMSDLRRRHWRDVSLDHLIENDGFALADAGYGMGSIHWNGRRAILDKMHEVIRDELTDRQRTVLLAELKGMPQKEIARRLDSNRNAVYKLAHDARKRLKRGLEAAGYEADDVHAAFDL